MQQIGWMCVRLLGALLLLAAANGRVYACAVVLVLLSPLPGSVVAVPNSCLLS